MIEQNILEIMLNQDYSCCKLSHDLVIKSGYSCDQQESTRLSKDHGLSSEGIKVIWP